MRGKILVFRRFFTEIFPIKSYDEKTVLEFLSYNLGIPKYSPEECIRRGITYNVTLKVKFRLTDETGDQRGRGLYGHDSHYD